MAGFGSTQGFNSRLASTVKLGKAFLGNPNNIWTVRCKHTLSASIDTRVNTTTFNTVWQCPWPRFDKVRLIYANNLTGGNTFNVKSIVAVSADVGVGGAFSTKKYTANSNNATITNDGQTGWQAITFGGASSGTVPAGISGSESTNYGLLFSDWVNMTSVTPTNGATRPFLITRTIVPSSTTTGFSVVNHQLDTINKTFDSHMYRETLISTGDFVSSSPDSFSGGSDQTGSPVIGVEFMVSTRIIRILCVGDSITQGLDNTNSSGNTWTDYRSWISYASDNLVNAGVPVNMINDGFSGATTTQIHDFGKRAIDAHMPDVVFYPPFSTNDLNESSAQAPTQFQIDQEWQRALDFANYALSKNVLPVFSFMAPKDYTADVDAFRVQIRNRIIASGFAHCNLSEAVGDGATPERYKTGYNSDATHPNAAGYQAMANVASAVVLDLLNSNIAW